MYLLGLIPVYIITYCIGIMWLQVFFGVKIKVRGSIFDILIIIFAYIFSLFIVVLIPEPEMANRFQHAISGGCIVTLIGYLAYLQSGVKINSFQLFHILIFAALTLGIINELAESVLQIQFGLTFSTHMNDTWYDLWANSVGAILGAGVFSYLGIWKK